MTEQVEGVENQPARRPPAVLRLMWDVLTAPQEGFRTALQETAIIPSLSVLSIINLSIAWASLPRVKEYSLYLVQKGRHYYPGWGGRPFSLWQREWAWG
ncbi:MAG: hypothetical protein STSR0004_17370 [Peptococcaceae bacterium]